MNGAVLHTSPSRRETGVPSRHSCPDGCTPRCCFILLSVESSVIGLLDEPMHGLRDAERHKSTPQEVRAMNPCHQWTTQTIVSNNEIGLETQLVSSSPHSRKNLCEYSSCRNSALTLSSQISRLTFDWRRQGRRRTTADTRDKEFGSRISVSISPEDPSA